MCTKSGRHTKESPHYLRFGTKRDRNLVTAHHLKSVRTQAKQCIRRLFHHQWHTPSLRWCPLPVVEIPAAGRMYMSWRMQKRVGAILKSEEDEQKKNHLNLALNIHTDTHTHRQTHTHSISYLVSFLLSCSQPPSPHLLPPLPEGISCTPMRRY